MSTSNNINIIPTKVEYILDIFIYNKEFQVLIYTSYRLAVKKIDIKSHIIQKHKEYKDIQTISTILKISKDLEIKNPKNIQLLRFN